MFLTKIQVSKFEAKSLKLENSYKWHQAVWQAFPSNQKTRTFLFRVDEQKKGFDVFLFSENPPTPQIWGSWELQKITNTFWTHQRYRFKLLANPTRKKITMLDEHTRKKNGRRVGITEESELIEWLQRKAENSGFEIIDCSVSVLGAKSFYRKKQKGTHFAVNFCGHLFVSNKTTFIHSCVTGIGSAKTFGFGLLLLEPSTHTNNTTTEDRMNTHLRRNHPAPWNYTSEPRLSDEDDRAWASFKRAALLHSRSYTFKDRVAHSINSIKGFSERFPKATVAWSGGKDSTVLVHLIRVELGIDGDTMSVRGALDYPGQLAYIQELAKQWNISHTHLNVDFDLIEYMKEQLKENLEDFHTRQSQIAHDTFYKLIEDYDTKRYNEHGSIGTFFGLRAAESRARNLNFRSRGLSYQKKPLKNGTPQHFCQPMAKWEGLDVFAYLFSREIEPFHIYKCCAYNSPVRIRDDWSIGDPARHGALVWLKQYYPSLYNTFCSLHPHISAQG